MASGVKVRDVRTTQKGEKRHFEIFERFSRKILSGEKCFACRRRRINYQKTPLLSGRYKHIVEINIIIAKIGSLLLTLEGTDMVPSIGQVC
jgi:hypothetical protein